MAKHNRRYKDSVFVDRQRLYIREQSLTSSFEQSSKHRNAGTTAIHGAVEQCTSMYTAQR